MADFEVGDEVEGYGLEWTAEERQTAPKARGVVTSVTSAFVDITLAETSGNFSRGYTCYGLNPSTVSLIRKRAESSPVGETPKVGDTLFGTGCPFCGGPIDGAMSAFTSDGERAYCTEHADEPWYGYAGPEYERRKALRRPTARDSQSCGMGQVEMPKVTAGGAAWAQPKERFDVGEPAKVAKVAERVDPYKRHQEELYGKTGERSGRFREWYDWSSAQDAKHAAAKAQWVKEFERGLPKRGKHDWCVDDAPELYST